MDSCSLVSPQQWTLLSGKILLFHTYLPPYHVWALCQRIYIGRKCSFDFQIEGKTGKSYSFGDLNSIISTVAGNLYHTAGVRKGDVILFNIPNSIEHSILIMATFSLGAIVSGCNPLNTKCKQFLFLVIYVYCIVIEWRSSIISHWPLGNKLLRTVAETIMLRLLFHTKMKWNGSWFNISH